MRPRKREAIVATAHRLFLERGYDGTSMDDVAATSGASKTTVYSNFEDKQQLFTAVVVEVTERAQRIVDELAAELAAERPADERLRAVARRLARGVLDPAVIQLRRLAIAEALRFPELVNTYWDRAPGRTVAILETALTTMDAAGDLDVPDPHAAALQFAYAVVGPLQDHALLRPGDAVTETDIDAHAEAAAERFVRAYAPET